MKKFLLLLVSLALCAGASAQSQARYNRYGMKLKDKDDRLVIVGTDAYKKLGIKAKELPDAYKPYKPKFKYYDKNSLSAVIPEDLVYKTGKDGSDLHLMYYRTGLKKSPVVFFVHGGGWTGGSYTASQKLFKTLAGKYGIAVVSIEYTLADVEGAKVEDAFRDCCDAVDHVLKSKEFDVNAKRIGFIGYSAGGQLAAMCALKYPQTKVFIGQSGAYDLPLSLSILAPESKAQKRESLNGYFNGFDDGYLEEYSPVHIAKTVKKITFNTCLFYGTADITIGPDNAERFAAALRKAGAKTVESEAYKNVTHLIFNAYCANEVFVKTIEFLDTYL